MSFYNLTALEAAEDLGPRNLEVQKKYSTGISQLSLTDMLALMMLAICTYIGIRIYNRIKK